jgi:hypothetical protein
VIVWKAVECNPTGSNNAINEEAILKGGNGNVSEVRWLMKTGEKKVMATRLEWQKRWKQKHLAYPNERWH